MAEIKVLETRGLPLSGAFKVLQKVEDRLTDAPGSKAQDVRRKFAQVMAKNSGLKAMKKVSDILEGKTGDGIANWSPSEIASMKFCSIVSVDVERAFSMFKNILTDRRRATTEENLNKMVVCYCFKNMESE